MCHSLKKSSTLVGALLVVVAILSVCNNAMAGTNCMSFPISMGNWTSQGKSGGACRLSSPFGWRELSPGKRTFHGGVDLSCKEGTPILAPVDGTAFHESFADGGNHVIRISSPGLDAKLGYPYKVSLLHNMRWAVETGALVRSGDTVAYLGNEGHSTGAHVHVQITKVGDLSAAIDPTSFSCGDWPSSSGGVDESGDPMAPSNSDAHSGGVIYGQTSPAETPPRAPDGLDEESRIGDLNNDIQIRAFNVEYVKQLATLGEVSLYRELHNMNGIEARMDVMRARIKEHHLASLAAIVSLRTRQLQPALDKQKSLATGMGAQGGPH